MWIWKIHIQMLLQVECETSMFHTSFLQSHISHVLFQFHKSVLSLFMCSHMHHISPILPTKPKFCSKWAAASVPWSSCAALPQRVIPWLLCNNPFYVLPSYIIRSARLHFFCNSRSHKAIDPSLTPKPKSTFFPNFLSRAIYTLCWQSFFYLHMFHLSTSFSPFDLIHTYWPIKV